jgi:Fibronectin type III domain
MYLPKAGDWKKLWCLWLLVLACLAGHAQIYPVDVSTQITPPYDVYLPDYASPGGEKLRIVLLQRDLTIQGYRLRFEMKIQVNGITIMQTSPSATPPPITLQPGIPTVLGGSDINWYVQPQNLEFGGGYSASTYEATRALPEGPVTITFTAYDYIRSNVQVSLPSSASFYASLNQPPLLNYPACGMQIAPLTPQFINFSWLPQNTSSPNSALSTNYIFSIWAVLPAGYSYQDIVQSAAPIYSTTVQQPDFVYGPAQPMLTPGQQYAWRIQAVDASGRDIFANNGISQTCYFNYTGDSSQGIINYPDIQINAAAVSAVQGKLWWTGDNGSSLDTSGYTQYLLSYRQSQGDNAWFTDTVVADTMYRLFNLEPSTAYEGRIQGYKGGSYGPYSNIASFTTPAQPVVSCTDSTNMLNPSSGTPLAIASPGMILTYGPWNVTLTTVQPLGAAGQFKGTCTVSIPFMGGTSFYATFTDLTVDNSRNVTAGNINFVSQSMQSFVDSSINNEMGGSLYGKVVSGSDTVNVTVPVSLANITELPVTLGPDSTIASFTIPGTPPVVVTVNDSMEEVTIKDSTGSTYALDNQGDLTQLTFANPSMQSFFATPANVAGLDALATGMGVVNFTDADSKFAFDSWQPFYSSASTILTGQYQQLTGGYYVAQKAIGSGESDIVGVSISLAPGLSKDSLLFATGTGTQLIWDSTDNTVNLLGGPAADAQVVYALYPKPGGGYYSLGKLQVSAYEQQSFTVVVVPVVAGDGVVPAINTQQIADSLNSIYNKVNVSWTVVADSAYNNVPAWDANGDGTLTMTGSSMLSNKLVGEPAALMKSYMSARSMDKTKPYLFVLNTSNGSTGDPGGAAGDMPRGQQYGFLFLNQAGTPDQAAVAAAHELGHGQFNLEHTFSGDIGLSQGATAAWPNLMDYVSSNARRLYKYQWGQIHQPGQVLGIFESDTAGQSIILGGSLPNQFLNEDNTTFSFLTPSGKVIVLPKKILAPVFFHGIENQDLVDEVTGVLAGFTQDGITYLADVDGNGNFNGYKGANGGYYSDQSYTNNTTVDKVVMGLPASQNYTIYGFGINPNWLKYSFTQEPLADEDAIGLELFTGNPVVKGNTSSYSYNTSVLGNTPTKISSSEVNDISKYPNTPTLLYLLKIEQIKNWNSGMFSQFTDPNRYLDWTNFSPLPGPASSPKNLVLNADLGHWDSLVMNNVGGLKDEWTQGQYEPYFRTMLDSLKSFMEQGMNGTDNFWANLTIDTAATSVDWQLTLTSDDQLASLPLNTRILALRIATKGCIVDGTDVFPNGTVDNNYEANLVRLVSTTPASDGTNLLTSLVQSQDGNNQEALISALTTDVCGLDGGDFINFVNAVSVFAIKGKVANYDNSVIGVGTNRIHKRFLSFDPSFWASGNAYANVNSDGRISFEYLSNITPDDYDSVKVTPYASVTIQFQSDKITVFGTFKADSCYTMPAIMAYTILHSVMVSNFKTGGVVLVNVALLSTGIGAFGDALLDGSVGAMMASAVDVGVGVTNILVETKYKDILGQTDQGKSILQFWEGVNLLYGGAQITTTLVNAATTAKVAAETMEETTTDAQETATLSATETEADNIIGTGASSQASGLLNVDEMENLAAQTPTGQNLTNLSITTFQQYGMTIAIPQQGIIRDLLQDIMQNGDLTGAKTEEIMDLLMEGNGYQKIAAKYNGSNGFDGVYIKATETIDNASQIFIMESKQFKQSLLADFDGTTSYGAAKGVVLNSPNTATGLPAQMSDQWILYVAGKLEDTDADAIGQKIQNFMNYNRSKVIKYVNAVDKSSGNFLILKLNSY